MNGDNLSLYVASYDDAAAANDDFQALKAAREDGLEIVGAVVMTHSADGDVDVSETGGGEVAGDASLGAVGGLVVGLFAPPLLLSTAIGAGIGADPTASRSTLCGRYRPIRRVPATGTNACGAAITQGGVRLRLRSALAQCPDGKASRVRVGATQEWRCCGHASCPGGGHPAGEGSDQVCIRCRSGRPARGHGQGHGQLQARQ